MDDETRAEFKATRDLIRRIEDKLERRDLILFGDDGRGGLVGAEAERQGREAVMKGVVYGLVLPTLVGLITWNIFT